MTAYKARLEQAKRASTAQLLFKCGRLVNEHAIATLVQPAGAPRLRPSHMSLFPHIALEGGTRVSELSQKLGISRQAVAQLVDDLDTHGLTERLPDPLDGRARLVAYTRKGRSAMLEGMQHLHNVDQQLESVIGKREMAQLHRCLLLLHDCLEKGELAGVGSSKAER